jgi:hypothetical protein
VVVVSVMSIVVGVGVAMAVMTTIVAVALAIGVEAAGMKGTVMEGGAGMVAAPLPRVQEARSGLVWEMEDSSG